MQNLLGQNFWAVTIDFGTSHLIFPTIIAVILSLLGLAIALRHRSALIAAPRSWCRLVTSINKTRFGGTLVLTLIYFSSMEPIGAIWPNTGLGFLLCSIPYVFAIGVLFMRERTLPGFFALGAVAFCAPFVVWWLFTDLFFLTLP